MGVAKRFLQTRSNLENPQYPLTSKKLIELFGGSSQTDTGINVSPESSMGLTAVFRAVSLIAGTGAGLPLHVYKDGTREKQNFPPIETPHPDITDYELKEFWFVHLLLWGNAYTYVRRNGAGQITELWPLAPNRVRVEGVDPTPQNPQGKVFHVTGAGITEPYTSKEIFHIPGLGYDGIKGLSPIAVARQAMGLGLAAERFGAQFFGRGSLMAGILSTDQKIDEGIADRLKARWKEKVTGLNNAHDIAVLDAGAKFQPVSIPPNDAQFIETRRFQVSEVARLFGTPPHMLMDVEKSTSWGTGIEQQGIGFVVYTMKPWLNRVEARLKRHVLPRDRYARFEVKGLLRGDTAARYNAYHVARLDGWMNADDIRELEDMPPIGGPEGTEYWKPSNIEPADAIPIQQEEPTKNDD